MLPLPIANILIEDRQRLDHSNTDGLKESLQQYGTIQPIVVEALSGPIGTHTHRLIAGGRRLGFLVELGHTELHHGSTYNPKCPGYVFGRDLTKDILHELELEENLRRKAMTWQERALSIANLHQLKVIRLGEEGKTWSQRLTGELMNISLGKVNYVLAIAQLLKSDAAHPLWKLDGMSEAIRWILDQKINEAMAEKARRQAEASAANVDASIESLFNDGPIVNPIDIDTKSIAREQYLSNPLNDPEKFDEYYEYRLQQRAERTKITLTPRLFLGSCLDFFKDNVSRFDHIITDPPYAIDMDMLDQQNLGMSNIDTVRDTHDVADNLRLLFSFFPLAYDALKSDGFLCLWCDVSIWNQLFSWAKAAGFKVQRWPVVWVKTHQCQNAAATFNFTKTTEVAMICRKGNATLTEVGPLGHIIASHDEYKDTMDHPFVKPFACWEHLVKAVSMEGQTILDPFAGEGSGPVSFLRCNRNYFACESEEHHFNKLMENVKNEYRRSNPGAEFI